MQLVQFRTDGEVDRTSLRLENVERSKFAALAIVAHPQVTGVYRVQFVDEEYDRVAWDSYTAHEIAVGTPVGFRTRSEARRYAEAVAS